MQLYSCKQLIDINLKTQSDGQIVKDTLKTQIYWKYFCYFDPIIRLFGSRLFLTQIREVCIKTTLTKIKKRLARETKRD